MTLTQSKACENLTFGCGIVAAVRQRSVGPGMQVKRSGTIQRDTEECSGKGFTSPNLQVKSDGPFLPFSSLKLHCVAFIEVFDLIARCHAAAVKENLFAAIIRSDEPKALWSDYFLDSASHTISSSSTVKVASHFGCEY
jgi:hypothetical protein